MKHPTKEGKDGSPKLPYYLQQTRKGKEREKGGRRRGEEARGRRNPLPHPDCCSPLETLGEKKCRERSRKLERESTTIFFFLVNNSRLGNVITYYSVGSLCQCEKN